jgi:ABC-type Mn2+/Zn2+ transport system ATPase subunit
MEITIKNCNNIDSGKIHIEEKKLNIKFGINGTGKSTLAKAIQFKVEKEEGLNDLLPFKLRKENPDNLKSEVVINNEINSVSIFNEEYVKQFLFKPDELVSNSFEIFIKTPKYLETEVKIEKQLEDIKKIFVDNTELDQIILDFENLSKSFKTTKDGLSDASAISKGLKDGNKIDNIPENLKEYSPFIQNKEKCVSWLDWQIKGNDFSDGHENCPYCVAPTNEEKKEKIKSVSNEYDKNVIKNFIEIIRVLENLGDYFSSDAKTELEKITKKTDGLLNEEKNYLITIKGQIDTFLQRLKNLREISFHNLKDEKIKKKIDGFVIKIDELFDKLNSDKTKTIVNSFNKSLAKTSKEIRKLQKNIGIQKTEIRNSIDKNQRSINQFLKNAGYRYQVLIEDENEQYKIKLQHIDFEKNIFGGDQYLSFGERNAFALVLFMYEVLSKNSDLIILDDPISSFDRNKKYAILQMLFREDNSLKGKTVLMLTHDFEPLIDALKAVDHKFKNQANASFIGSKQSILKEQYIKKDDILTFPQIFQNIIKDNDVADISKLVYMRRNFEILNDKGDEYQILSDLFHKRSKADAKKFRQENINKKLSDEDFERSFQNGEGAVKKAISNFDYEKMLGIVKDKSTLKRLYNSSNNRYEKMQIFRIINGEFSKSKDFSDVFKKFINETYHIENDFIHQLNPQKYDLIPEFIIEECDKYIFLITE